MKAIIFSFVVFLLTIIIAVVSSSVYANEKEKQRAIVNGEQSFNELCASCHGENGKGEGVLIGTSINNQQFLSTFADASLFQMIDSGREEAMMPAFNQLPNGKKEEIVSYIRSWQTKSLKLKAPAVIAGNAVNGKELYSLYCASCHGESGSGLSTSAAAIAHPNTLQMMTDEQLWISTAYGRNETRMGPSLKGLDGVRQLEEQDISDIVTYIREDLIHQYDPNETSHTMP